MLLSQVRQGDRFVTPLGSVAWMAIDDAHVTTLGQIEGYAPHDGEPNSLAIQILVLLPDGNESMKLFVEDFDLNIVRETPLSTEEFEQRIAQHPEEHR